MKERTLPNKADVIRLLLESEGRVMLCLDASLKGVDVPRRFSHDPGLMLVLNSAMPQPIHILPDAVASELRFGGIPHYCVIPYAAIWSVFNPDTHHGMVWPEDMPEDMQEIQNEISLTLDGLLPEEEYALMGFEGEGGQPLERKGVGPVLTVIDGGLVDAPVERSVAATKKRKPMLRLVE
ncbi:MAG: hypothetical protein HQL90_14695 [Magnetococcales bacterium]|nr:hypothetical protein [Magnetococcales bacterium]